MVNLKTYKLWRQRYCLSEHTGHSLQKEMFFSSYKKAKQEAQRYLFIYNLEHRKGILQIRGVEKLTAKNPNYKTLKVWNYCLCEVCYDIY